MYRYPAFPAFAADLGMLRTAPQEWNINYARDHSRYATTSDWWIRANAPGNFVLISKAPFVGPFFAAGTWDFVINQARNSQFFKSWAICPAGQNIIIAQSKNWK